MLPNSLGLVVLLGVGVRLALLWRLPEVHHDEAVNGLMARHVLRGEFPIFYWGQDYGGTLESFLTAVPFALLDSSVVTLRLIPLGLSLVLMGLTFRLTRVVYDEPTARVAMLFAAVTPLVLLHLGVTAKNPYPEIPVLGALVLLLAIRLGSADGPAGGAALALGLVAGIAWWVQPLLVSCLAAAGLFVLAQRRGRALPREAVLGTGGFLLGSLPFWLYTVVQRGEALGLIRGAPAGPTLGQLGQIGRRDLPALLGASTPWPAAPVNRLVLLGIALVYLPACVFLVYEAAREVLRHRTLTTRALLPLTAGLILVVDAASGYASLGGAKYLFPLYAVLPALLAHTTITAGRALGPAVGVLLAVGILGLHVQEHARDLLNSLTPGYLEAQDRPPTARLAAFLRDRGLSHAYAHFRISLKLTFDTRETIVASDWYGFRSPRYLDEVQRAERVALVAHRGLKHPDPGVLDENLRALGGSFRRDDVDGFVVFHDFRPPAPGRPISAAQLEGRGLPRADGARQAYDRDGMTWWGSGEPQRPGLAYQVDLGRVYAVSHLSLHPGPVVRGTPRGYRVEVSRDAETWAEVARVEEVLAGLHWAGSQPRLDRSGRVRVGFEPVEGRHLRVTQTGRDRHFWWSVGEIFVYEAAPPDTASAGQAALSLGQRLERLAGWEYVGASPLARVTWRARHRADWEGVVAAYGRAIHDDPELEEAHHRLAVVLSRLEVADPAELRHPADLRGTR